MGLRVSLQHQQPISDDAVALMAPQGVMTWRAASGQSISHTVFSLLGCPPLQSATYMLVHRETDGSRAVLAVGRTHRVAATVNLARIRETGATLGANEVHVHPVCGADPIRAAIERDLALAHINKGVAADRRK